MNNQNTETVINVAGLTKKFRSFAALDKLDLSVRKGEVHGFLGPNGAGKSTTIRVLLGLLKKTSGDVSMLGLDPWKDSVELHKYISYVPGEVNLWPQMSGGEVIDLFADLRGGLDNKKRKQLLDDFQLDARKKCGTYSKGNRQKVALIAALASDAEIYILDEPTSGLDPLMETVFQNYVLELKNQGKTVLLSSHILAEVEKLADRVTIIRNGKTVEQGTLNELRHLSQQTVKASTRKSASGISKIKGVHDVKTEPKNGIEFSVEHFALGEAIEYLTQHGVEKLTSEPQSLEQLFMKHYDTGKKQ